MKRILASLALVGMACSHRVDPRPSAPEAGREGEPAASASAAAQTWRGFYVLGRHANLFSPCGSQESHWVLATNEIQRALREKYAHATAMPNQRTYVELRGAPAGRASEGPAASADGVIRVDELLLLRLPQPGDCER